jgi:hypothetical protein
MDSWTPILKTEGSLAAAAWESIDAISTSLSEGSTPSVGMRENCDIALLFAYLAAARKDRAYMMRAIERLNLAIAAVGPRSSYALNGGICGLGWTAVHVFNVLRKAGLCGQPQKLQDGNPARDADEGEDELCGTIDTQLLKKLGSLRPGGQYDLLSGVVGFGIYLLERLHSEHARPCIRMILQLLNQSAERTKEGIRWHTHPEFLSQWERERCPKGYYNLGVAHGLPGALFFLSEAMAAQIQPVLAEELLHGGVKWLAYMQNTGRLPARFDLAAPPFIAPPARLAWCYNDLGIAAVMLHVAHRTQREKYRALATDLLAHCLSVAGELGSPDAALCHGATGVAHIMSRLYRSQGDQRCFDAAISYYERSLRMRKPGKGIGGYSPAADGDDVSFLSGAVGIALALLSAVTPIEPRWDRRMLLSSCLQL